MEKTGCKVICGAPTTLAVKGLMMMMKKFTVFNEERGDDVQLLRCVGDVQMSTVRLAGQERVHPAQSCGR